MFVPPFICKFVLEFYNLVNRPADNIVVRPSRVRGEREKKKEDKIDERKNASTAGPCHTKTENNKTPRHCKPPSTIVRPNRLL